jgi:hypothetical protein
MDGEIITELYELFKKADQKEVVEVLKQYKFLKDEEIRDQLMECNLNFKKSEVDVDENGKQPPSMQKLLDTIKKLKDLLAKKTEFIVLNGERIAAYTLYGYRSEREYDTDVVFKGRLILNPCDIIATKVPLYANHTFEFFDEKELDDTIDLLDSLLKRSSIKFVKKVESKKNNKKEE